jgi:aryl-alcohol dehydrogenase-like predicted oxidoreductase
MTFGESHGFMKGVTSSDVEGRAVLERALEMGINFIDTADIYSEGRSEERLGTWLGTRRKDIVLATKCRFGMPGAGPMDQGLSRRHILSACDASLERLKTDYIDLYQVHMQDGSVPIEETLRALDDLVSSGKVRYVGCSNYTGYRLVQSLWAADKRNITPYQSIQLQWSLLERGAERDVLPACREFGLGVMVWSPLCRGFLSGRYQRGQQPPKGSRLDVWRDTYAKYDNEKSWQTIDAVVSIAKELQTSPARVALAWLLSKPLCHSIVIGARDVKQLEDNVAALEVKLSAEQLSRLDKISEPAWGYPYDFISSREAW